MMHEAITTAAAATVRGTRRSKRWILLAVGVLNVAGGALMTAAPHLQTVLTAKGFAITMIVTGVVVASLAFISTQLKSEED